MWLRVLLLSAILGLTSVQLIHAQESRKATGKGAALISGVLSFTNQGGDLYEDFEEKSLTTISIAPNVMFFAAPGVGGGVEVSLSRQAQGDASATVWSIGPKVGYFWESESNAIPFLSTGMHYFSVGSDWGSGSEHDSGFQLKAAGGVIFRKDHLGISIEAQYLHQRFKPDGADRSVTGNTVTVAVGFSGFLY